MKNYNSQKTRKIISAVIIIIIVIAMVGGTILAALAM